MRFNETRCSFLTKGSKHYYRDRRRYQNETWMESASRKRHTLFHMFAVIVQPQAQQTQQLTLDISAVVSTHSSPLPAFITAKGGYQYTVAVAEDGERASSVVACILVCRCIGACSWVLIIAFEGPDLVKRWNVFQAFLDVPRAHRSSLHRRALCC